MITTQVSDDLFSIQFESGAAKVSVKNNYIEPFGQAQITCEFSVTDFLVDGRIRLPSHAKTVVTLENFEPL